MKKLLLLSLCILLLLTGTVGVSAMSDAEEQNLLSVLGIMNGDENGNLNLDKNVTRAEFAKMLVSASAYRDSIPKISISTGFSDVEPTHWAAPYIRLASENKWIYGYSNGTFLPNNNIKLEEAATMLLRILGYTANDLTGVYPDAQLAMYDFLDLDENVDLEKGETVTRADCQHLFVNLLNTKTKTGQSYSAMLGLATNANGEIDLNGVITQNIKGPYVVETTYSALGLPINNMRVIRNNKNSSISEIKAYDVVYYSKDARTLLVYSKAISGTYSAASPSIDSPSQITVGNASYSINATDVSFSVSTLGQHRLGDLVTLLLGRNNEVVRVIPTSVYAKDVYGIVTGVEEKSSTDENGLNYSAKTVDIMLTTGESVSVEYNAKNFIEGDVVKLSYTDKPVLERQKNRAISGTVTLGEQNHIGEYKVASDVNVLEAGYEGENPASLFFSRLTGATLSESDVKFYVTDDNGMITDLILKDFTGDANIYGIITEAVDATDYVSEDSDFDYSGVNNSNQVYEYQIGAKSYMMTSVISYSAVEGPCAFVYSGGKLESVVNITELKSPSLFTSFGVVAGGELYLYSDDITVYTPNTDRKASLEYATMTLGELLDNIDGYNIKAYIDETAKTGGRVRLLIAKAK